MILKKTDVTANLFLIFENADFEKPWNLQQNNRQNETAETQNRTAHPKLNPGKQRFPRTRRGRRGCSPSTQGY
jgi:hypothetical protein